MTGRQSSRNKGPKNNGKRTQQQAQNDFNPAQNSEEGNMTSDERIVQPEVNNSSGSSSNRKKIKTSNPNLQETPPKPLLVPTISSGTKGPKGTNLDTADDQQNLDPNSGNKALLETDDQYIIFNKNELYTVTLDVTNVHKGNMLRALKQIKEFINQNDISYLNNNNRFFVKKKKGDTKKELYFTLDKDNLTKILNLTYLNTYNQTNADSSETTEVSEELKFIHYEKPLNKLSDIEKTSIDSRTLHVFNIPVKVNRDQIINSMKSFGTIINVRINMTKLYQSAYITYENQESITQFFTGKWSTFIGKHNVGAAPVILTQEQRDQ